MGKASATSNFSSSGGLLIPFRKYFISEARGRLRGNVKSSLRYCEMPGLSVNRRENNIRRILSRPDPPYSLSIDSSINSPGNYENEPRGQREINLRYRSSCDSYTTGVENNTPRRVTRRIIQAECFDFNARLPKRPKRLVPDFLSFQLPGVRLC